MANKRRKKKYTKRCEAGLTRDEWVMLHELKVRLHKSKATIIREALTEYEERHINAVD